MMRQFPTGFQINGEKEVPTDRLEVELPTQNKRVEFLKMPNGLFTISILDTAHDTRDTIGEDCSVAVAKYMIEYLFIPHKELDDKKFKRACKENIPKKNRRNKRQKHIT